MTKLTDKNKFQEDFLNKMQNKYCFTDLFDFLSDIFFFVKDKQSRFIMANRPFLDILGIEKVEEMIGLTDHNFFPPNIADRYFEEDRYVLENGEMTRDRLWLVPNSDNTLKWYLSTKMPLFDKKDNIIGLAGTMKNFANVDKLPEPYREMSEVVQHINDNYNKDIQITELADIASLSISQFDRRFKKVFGISPLKYITKTRIDAACIAIEKTNQTITQIAYNTGFNDHSYFTKVFFKIIGKTPKQYRTLIRKRANQHSKPKQDIIVNLQQQFIAL
ncbi:MAG: AraC family transcriptional regulator [Sedimentisphaeraceae bacterium JB056]